MRRNPRGARLTLREGIKHTHRELGRWQPTISKRWGKKGSRVDGSVDDLLGSFWFLPRRHLRSAGPVSTVDAGEGEEEEQESLDDLAKVGARERESARKGEWGAGSRVCSWEPVEEINIPPTPSQVPGLEKIWCALLI